MRGTSDLIRCFVAIEMPFAIQDRLVQIQDVLRKHIQRASWVGRANLHLTLRFLGEVERPQLAAIETAISRVTRNRPPFLLGIGGIGAFPSLMHPRVIWAGVTAGQTKVSMLVRGIDLELTRCGFPHDGKAFVPHLTIARAKELVDLQPFASVFRQGGELDSIWTTVEEIALVQSQLLPKGVVYTPITSCRLQTEVWDGPR